MASLKIRRIVKLLGSMIAGLVLLFLAVYVLWKISNARSFQFFGRIISRIETREPVIALTFDDGPDPEHTEFVLAVLQKYDVPATFFLNGAQIQQHMGTVREIVRAGHGIGNHTYSHQPMLLKSPGFIRKEIVSTDSLIRRAGYIDPIYFRPPYCKKLLALPYYLWRTGRITITWDVEPESYPEINGNTEKIIAHVLENTHPGSIILLHPMYSRQATRDGLEPIIMGLKAQGFQFVTVRELLHYSQQYEIPAT